MRTIYGSDMEIERIDDSDAPAMEWGWAKASVRIVAENDLASAPVVQDTEKQIVHRLLERSRPLPKFKHTSLQIDHQTMKAEKPSSRSYTLNFRYMTAEPEDDPRIAEMVFSTTDFRTFGLYHREVRPGLRRLNLGSELLHDAEEWFASFAAVRHKPVTIQIAAAQSTVIRWALKNGYRADPSSEALLQSVLNEPEEFIFEDIRRPDETLGEQYIFKTRTKEKTIHTALRIYLIKTLEPA